MPTLKNLLDYRIQTIKNRLPSVLQFELLVNTPCIEAVFTQFIEEFLLADIRKSFLQGVRTQTTNIIKRAFDQDNLWLITSNYSSIEASSIITQLFNTINNFYIDSIIQPWETYVVKAGKIEPILTELGYELNYAISKMNFPIVETSRGFSSVNELYIFNTIDSILRQVNLDMHKISCTSLFYQIKAEDSGTDEIIKDAIMLNALLMINEIELYIDKNNLNYKDNPAEIKELALHYFMQFQMRVANPLTLYSVDPLFAEICRTDCLLIESDAPALIDDDSMPSSTYTSPGSSPRLAVRKW